MDPGEKIIIIDTSDVYPTFNEILEKNENVEG